MEQPLGSLTQLFLSSTGRQLGHKDLIFKITSVSRDRTAILISSMAFN